MVGVRRMGCGLVSMQSCLSGVGVHGVWCMCIGVRSDREERLSIEERGHGSMVVEDGLGCLWSKKIMPSLCNCGHSLVRRGGLTVIRVMVRCQRMKK